MQFTNLQFTNKTCALTVGIIALWSLFVPFCFGQMKPGDMTVDIPFAFSVDDHLLPPGRYVINSILDSRLRIHNAELGVIFSTHSVRGKAREGTGKIVFHRYGDKYFLVELWTPANETGKQLIPSKSEKETARANNTTLAQVDLHTH